MSSCSAPVLIVGAGISGLTLAQACRKNNVPFRIFERNASATERSAGWGLTLHWSLATFLTLLPDEISSRLPETYVHKQAVDASERGTFTFFDLSNGDAKWRVTAAQRIRVSRERLCRLLQCGIDVEWSKKALNLNRDNNGVVNLSFSDGTSATGSLVVGCDGANSVVRSLLHPTAYENYKLPIRFLGAGAYYNESQIRRLRTVDPFFFQGGDPSTDAFFWFSFLDCPGDIGVSLPRADNGEQVYRCQVMISWPYRKGFLGRAEPTDVPNTTIGQRSLMETISDAWTEQFRSVIHNMPSNAEIRPIELSDWVPQVRKCSVYEIMAEDSASRGTGTERVVLVGDAAHTMVMFRGEGANHAIVDIAKLLEQIRHIYSPENAADSDRRPIEGEADRSLDEEFARAIDAYEAEMLERTKFAVRASRQACLDANEYARVNDDSPLICRQLPQAALEAITRSQR